MNLITPELRAGFNEKTFNYLMLNSCSDKKDSAFIDKMQ